ncbi:MAG: alpha/beta hydrolase [Pseudomonadota bacterium]
MSGSGQMHTSFAASLFMRRTALEPTAEQGSIILLHGNSFDGSIFQPLMVQPVLSDRDLIAFDLPGHGASACLPPSQSYNFASMASRVIEAIETLDLKDVTIFGWSLGAHIALEALDRSQRIKNIIMCGAPPMPNNPVAALFAMHFTTAMLLATKRNFNELDAIRFEQLTLGGHANGHNIAAHLAADGRMRAEIGQSVMRLQNRDQRKLALNAGKRLCILNAGQDPLIRSEYISRFANEPAFSGQSLLLETAGHTPFLDQPEAIANLLIDASATALPDETGLRRAA